MRKLPQFQSDNSDLNLMQNSWGGILNPVISNPVTNGLLLTSVNLVSGANVVNHKLGRKLQGWLVIRKRASSDLYDTQDSNQMPELTLDLVASANVVVDLYVF